MIRLLFSRPSLNFRGDRHYQVDDFTNPHNPYTVISEDYGVKWGNRRHHH